MAQRIGELLITLQLITQAQLEEALQAQVIFGGKLGTVIIEMGLVSEKAMARALADQLGFPCLQPDDLEKIPGAIIALVSQELAEKFQVIPLSVNGRKLTLAMANPCDIQAIDEISFRTGYIILPVLALEVRLFFALERYYGIKRAMRYISPPRPLIREEPATPPVSEKAGSEADESAEEEYLGAPGSEHVFVPGRTTVVAPPLDEEPIEELEELHVSLEDTARRLVAATNRNDVADALIEYLGANFARAALFMVVAGQVTGWRAVKNHEPITAIDQFQLPLSEQSVLRTAVEGNSLFLGPVPQSGANLALITLLGRPAPTTAALLPLSMLGRVVGVIYVDDPATDMAAAVVPLQKIAAKALLAFELLILQSKILRS